MKKLTIITPATNVTETEISDFEKKYNITFPGFFKEFLLLHNGAGTEEHLYQKGESTYVINNFLPLLICRNSSMELALPIVRDPEFYDRNDMLPFAFDPGGIPYFLAIGESNYGEVYYGVLGLGEKETVRKIAPTFVEFINGLQKDER